MVGNRAFQAQTEHYQSIFKKSHTKYWTSQTVYCQVETQSKWEQTEDKQEQEQEQEKRKRKREWKQKQYKGK